jgi:thiol-disulfide isomerase/thioredoxin
MKELIWNVVLFVVLCVAFSSLEGCSGSQGNAPAINGYTAGSKPGGPPADKSAVFPPITSGMAAVDIEALDGTKTKVSEHKGKFLVLNLWGIWCGPCRDEMPHLAQMQKQYASKGLEVISLNVGDHELRPEPMENIKKYVEQAKLDYPIARITSDSVNQFYMVSKAQAIPQTFLIDRDSRLRGVWVGGGQGNINQIQQTLDKAMNE